MRSLIRSIGIAGAFLLLVGVHNASAQITDPVEFTTSFPFTVGQATMPAGSYTIKPDLDASGYLVLTGSRGSVYFQTDSAEARQTPSKTEVVFKHYGSGYVLKDIWVEGSNEGAEASTSEPERHAVRESAAAPAEHRVAALRKKSDTTARNR
jgi:hypothetical protein